MSSNEYNHEAIAALIAAAREVDTIYRACKINDPATAIRRCIAHNELADALAQLEPEPTYAEKLHSGARLHMAHGHDIETAKRVAAMAIRAGEEDH
jgi:hypothetical protein